MYFSDYFDVSIIKLEGYGALNISLISDLPLFIDPFLLFNSTKTEYTILHNEIITYLIFLRDKSKKGLFDEGLINSWYKFKEVKQNWLGYSVTGNSGNGLGRQFARALNRNLENIFNNFGKEKIATGSHLEKLCLIDTGVGKDHISDFATNLIKKYLLNYTQIFTKKYINKQYKKEFNIRKVNFNYQTETWESGVFELPIFKKDFVLLTPKDILSKDDQWINKNDLIEELDDIIESIPNEQLRSQLNNYLFKALDRIDKENEKKEFKRKFIIKNPELVEYYIKYKEQHGEEATNISKQRVSYIENILINNINDFLSSSENKEFYSLKYDTSDETKKRIEYFKHIIEDKDGYKIFYDKNGKPIRNEKDAQLVFKFVWYGTPLDVNSEVNNGRGPVDFSISYGKKNKTLVEFKLASNSQLKRNLKNQVEIYKKSQDTNNAFKVIIYFEQYELNRVIDILQELNLTHDESIVLVDATRKRSASKF